MENFICDFEILIYQAYFYLKLFKTKLNFLKIGSKHIHWFTVFNLPYIVSQPFVFQGTTVLPNVSNALVCV